MISFLIALCIVIVSALALTAIEIKFDSVELTSDSPFYSDEIEYEGFNCIKIKQQ